MVLYPKEERENLLPVMLYAQRGGLFFLEYRVSRGVAGVAGHQVRVCTSFREETIFQDCSGTSILRE